MLIKQRKVVKSNPSLPGIASGGMLKLTLEMLDANQV